MYLLVVKTTGHIVLVKPDDPKPVWGRKEIDPFGMFEVVHMTEDEFKAGATAAIYGLPVGDRVASGRDVIDIVEHAKAVIREPHPVCALPFGQYRDNQLVTKSAVTLDVANASIGVTPDGRKKFGRAALKKNWVVAVVLEKP